MMLTFIAASPGRVGWPDSTKKHTRHPVSLNGPSIAWDILILRNYSLFIWNVNLTGNPVFGLAVLPQGDGARSTPHPLYSSSIGDLDLHQKQLGGAYCLQPFLRLAREDWLMAVAASAFTPS